MSALVVSRRNAALDAGLTGITHAQLHTGDPGSAGTDNVASGVDRAALSGAGGATGGQDVLTGTWTIPGAGGPYTHVTLWTAETGGEFAGPDDAESAKLSPQEEFAGAGTLGLTVTVTAS